MTFLQRLANFLFVTAEYIYPLGIPSRINFCRCKRSEVSERETFQALHRVCDRYLFDEDLFLKLKSFNASLAIIDANFMSNCLVVFAYKLRIPFIVFGIHNHVNIHRTPWAFSVFRHMLSLQPKGTPFFQRISNTLANVRDYLRPAIGSPGRSIKDYVPGRPDIPFEDLFRQAELFIVDSDVFLDPALPALPNVKYIGGMASQPAEPLQGNILDFINASKNGVIVVSPGSLISWEIHARKMEEAFSKIKYDVVWKHSNSSYSRPNVLLTKWLPQNDLLGHPNTKLFITHCGNSGQYESLYHAVPMIGFPVFADQPFNGYRMQIKGYGISMDMYTYTVDELVKNIKEVIENPRYKKNIAKASMIFRSQKERPAEKAARHIDEIMKYGGDHLRSECQHIPLYQFLMLDIWAVLLSATFLFVLVVRRRKKSPVRFGYG
ncbi:UGT [Acanthosepion pharaonis]|uniref:UDP-glucuronosyltransferase n=1 Tax=Acanthosepion pharaonis TaxID=158019 RepID=A0A812DAI0_ACAPH|nr:UGT [Sepia pharaonis]